MGEAALVAELDACPEAREWDVLVESASIGPASSGELPDTVPQAAEAAGYRLLPRRPAIFDEVEDLPKFDLVLVFQDAVLLSVCPPEGRPWVAFTWGSCHQM